MEAEPTDTEPTEAEPRDAKPTEAEPREAEPTEPTEAEWPTRGAARLRGSLKCAIASDFPGVAQLRQVLRDYVRLLGVRDCVTGPARLRQILARSRGFSKCAIASHCAIASDFPGVAQLRQVLRDYVRLLGVRDCVTGPARLRQILARSRGFSKCAIASHCAIASDFPGVAQLRQVLRDYVRLSEAELTEAAPTDASR